MPREIVLARYGHTQSTPSISWIIDHNLNILDPVVDVWIVENGVLINSDAHDVTSESPTRVVVSFSGSPTTGQALVT